MKKIGIITINDYNNYGNRLQNYALQELLSSLGLNISTVVNKSSKEMSPVNNTSLIGRVNRLNNITYNELSRKIRSKAWRTLNKKEILKTNSIRLENFIDFTNKNISETSFHITEKKLQIDKIQDYDFFVSGSDQVWNPNFRYGSGIDFLTFAPPKKRISYAASFGVSQIPEQYTERYRQWLSEMSNISVREKAGAQIVKNLTGRNVAVHADPTLILPKDKWLSVAKRASNRPDTPYLLTYFLGGPTKETRKKLEKLAKEHKISVINLGDITEHETYKTGPSEFLDYINNASAFFTDSFHGVVFSIIFQTPFIVFERQSSGPSMYSRIETILDNFDMRDREANGFDKDIFSMDFSGTHEVLEREYNKSINYLKEALRIEE